MQLALFVLLVELSRAVATCDSPLQSTQLLFGADEDREMADHICCHNTYYAEPSGYFAQPHVSLFSKMDSEGVTTFYDSTCGIPLFQAPVGRTRQEWEIETSHHGWPSFRPAEIVAGNIVIKADGEVRSKCGTHLGHNLPDSKGNRYCIDLVCIAGTPPQSEEGSDNEVGATEVYFGNGCFWERQYAYVQLEMDFFQRSQETVTSLCGYAGGNGDVGSNDLVCYHHSGGNPGDVYSQLGHAEVVLVTLDGSLGSGDGMAPAGHQFLAIAKDYFGSFHRTGAGMARPDPGDQGAEYRNVVGIPGGLAGPWFSLLEEANIHNMDLREGKGSDSDELGVVWVMDSDLAPFHRAESYHQFHSNFFGESYGSGYLSDLRDVQKAACRINPTGCPNDDDESFGKACESGSLAGTSTGDKDKRISKMAHQPRNSNGVSNAAANDAEHNQEGGNGDDDNGSGSGAILVAVLVVSGCVVLLLVAGAVVMQYRRIVLRPSGGTGSGVMLRSDYS